jgi:hypothetical protein
LSTEELNKLASMLSMVQKNNQSGQENPEAIKANVKTSEERVNEKEYEKSVFIA